MFKMTQKYQDFLGNDQEETFRFNFTENEMLTLAKKSPLFNADVLSVILAERKVIDMYQMVKELVLESYGKLSEDAKHFRKSEEIKRDFEQSAAFDAILDKLLGPESEKLIPVFIENVFPAKFAAEIKKNSKNASAVAAEYMNK